MSLSGVAARKLGTALADASAANEIVAAIDANTAAFGTAGVVVASAGLVPDSNLDLGAFRNLVCANLDAGASGTAGTVDVFPTTAAKGKVQITTADNSGDTTTTFTFAAQAAARTYTVPDAGASASFVMTAAAQSIAGAKTFTGGIVVTTAGVTITDVDIALGTSTGTKIGTATSQKLAFHNSTPVAQRAGAAQDAVATTAATSTTPFGFAEAQANAIVALVNELRAALVEKGIIKGAA